MRRSAKLSKRSGVSTLGLLIRCFPPRIPARTAGLARKPDPSPPDAAMTTRRFLYTLTFCFVIPAAARADVDLPTGGILKSVDFERHVMGLLSKAGCNAGSCHGSFQGKNGFRLSLFGYDPAMDFAALTRDNLGRRVNLVDPDDSLLLLKAAGRMPHDGGMRFGKDFVGVQPCSATGSPAAQRGRPAAGRSQKLAVTPERFRRPRCRRSRNKLKVTRHLRRRLDGRHHAVLRLPDHRRRHRGCLAARASDAAATGRRRPRGALSRQRPGHPRAGARADRSRVATRTLPEANYIDREVFAKLKLLNMVPAGLVADEVVPPPRLPSTPSASLPTPDEVREFLADKDPKKREKLIDKLLAHPLHAALWATKLSDITGNNTQALEQPAADAGRRGRRCGTTGSASASPRTCPYDEMVRDILTATSRDGMTPGGMDRVRQEDRRPGRRRDSTTDYPNKKTLDLFWRRQQQVPIEQWGEKVAAAFLGVRLECAQCHKHPTDRWTQDDYWAFANIFTPVVFRAESVQQPGSEEGGGRGEQGAPRRGRLRRQERTTRWCRSARCSSRHGGNNNRRPESGQPQDAPNRRPRRAGDRREAGRRSRGPARRVDHAPREPVLRPQLRQPRLGPLLRRRHRQPGGRFLARQPADQRPAARTPSPRDFVEAASTSASSNARSS